MKLLLTSAGPSNDALRGALVRLLGRPIADCSAVHIPTAVYAMAGGLGSAAEMGRYWSELGWKTLGQLELTALPSLPEEFWLPELQAADAILVGGGITGYLSHWFHRSGFADVLPGLLERCVYVGVSAGSMVVTPELHVHRDRLSETGDHYDDEYDEAAPLGAGDDRGVGLVDFLVRPHLNSTQFGVDLGVEAMSRAAAKVDRPLYAIDDESGLMVVDGHVDVVSEGEWRLFPPGDR